MENMKYLLNCRSFISLIVLFSFFDNFGVKKYDYQFKVLIVGDAVVGKTQIVSRYVKDSFVEEYKYTEGIGLGSKSISFNTILGITSILIKNTPRLFKINLGVFFVTPKVLPVIS